jgi:hypothetical protein
MQIKPQTLMVAVQCVAAQIEALDHRLQDEPSDAAELEQLLVSFDLAAADLKTAYQEAVKVYGGLPKYDELIPPANDALISTPLKPKW